MEEYKIGIGIYKAGVDIPVGLISVQATKMSAYDFSYGFGKTQTRLILTDHLGIKCMFN